MSQIFKHKFPIEILLTLIEDISELNNSAYIVNTVSFKKGMFNGTITQFLDDCKPFYHISKLKYLERKITYSSFITIIRQICNANNIKYTSTIRYDKSKYDIIYYIYFTP